MRIAFIGAGKLAGARSKQLCERDDVTITGYVGQTMGRSAALAKAYGAAAYDSVDALLHTKTYGVVICTPCNTHASLVKTALEGGIHAFAEYPLAFTKAELAGIAEAAANRELQVGVGCNHLETMAQLRESIGELGTVFSAYHDGFFGTSSRQKWYWDAAQSGGTWMLWGIDQIASLVYLLGRVKSVTSKRTAAFDRDDLSETANAIVEFATGAVGVIQTTIHAPGYFMSLRLVGSEGSVDCLHSAGGSPFLLRRRGSKEQLEIPIVPRGKRLDLDAWLDSFVTGQNHVMPLEDILHWHDVAFACQESQATGRTVELATCPTKRFTAIR